MSENTPSPRRSLPRRGIGCLRWRQLGIRWFGLLVFLQCVRQGGAARELLEFLPTLPGFKREDNPQGTTDPTDNVSRISAAYNQDGGVGTIGVEITDSARDPNVLLILKDELKAGGGNPLRAIRPMPAGREP